MVGLKSDFDKYCLFLAVFINILVARLYHCKMVNLENDIDKYCLIIAAFINVSLVIIFIPSSFQVTTIIGHE